MLSLFDWKTYRRAIIRWVIILGSGVIFVYGLMKFSIVVAILKDPILVLLVNFFLTWTVSFWVQRLMPPARGVHPGMIRGVYAFMEAALFGCYVPAVIVLKFLTELKNGSLGG